MKGSRQTNFTNLLMKQFKATMCGSVAPGALFKGRYKVRKG